MTKLTLEELEYIQDNNEDNIHYYRDYDDEYSSAFRYKKNDNWTLIQSTDEEEGGEILVEDAHYVEWYEKDVFQYENDNGYTLVEDGEVLIENVKNILWHRKGIFEYKNDNGYTLVENGEVLIKNVDKIEWYADEESIFKYEKDGKETLIRYGKVLIKNADEIRWRRGNVVYYFKDGEWDYININD